MRASYVDGAASPVRNNGPVERRRLILASGSPRRRVLLRRAGFVFDVVTPDVREDRRDGESPQEMVERLAVDKARAVITNGSAVVLAADTTVALDGEPLGKPLDAADAVAMLIRLSSRDHEVITGLCLASGGRVLERSVARSAVTFSEVDISAAEAYVATGEPLDKAGAYAIQGLGRRFVSGIEGSFTNVMGLPMEYVEPLLRRHGVHPSSSRSEPT